MQALSAAALVFGVITNECGMQSVRDSCVDGCVLPGEISYPSPKVAGKVKNLSSSIQIRISCFSGADFCSSIYFTVMLLFYGSRMCFFYLLAT